MTNNNRTAFVIIAVLLVGVAALLVLVNQTPSSEIKTLQEGNVSKFSSQQELTEFLKAHQIDNSYYGSGVAESFATAGAQIARSSDVAAPSGAPSLDSDEKSSTYSTTNVQIQGVDEPDFVKNDDKYIYIASASNLSIVQAHPATDANLLSVIDLNGTAQQLFLNGDLLVVFGQEHYNYPAMPVDLAVEPAIKEDSVDAVAQAPASTRSSSGAGASATSIAADAKMGLIRPDYYYHPPQSFIKIYDVSNPSTPVIKRVILYDGSYYDARMIGDTVYTIVNQPMYYTYQRAGQEKATENESLTLPAIQDNGVVRTVIPSDIYYFDVPDYSYQLTTILAIDLTDDSTFEKKSFLTGYTQTIFVSENNIYLTAPKQYDYAVYQRRLTQNVMLEVVDAKTAQKIQEILDSDLEVYEKESQIQALFETYYNTLSEKDKKDLMQLVQNKTREEQEEIQKELQRTIIHKIAVDGLTIAYQGRGEVPGNVLNQFSMDEHNGYLRVATTVGEVWQGTSVNNIYVLDEDLAIVGKVEDLAKGERIYSARFILDRAYMVTFKNTDPLFVIDLSDPTAPTVLGELKIPGYSDYLHPYDETHLIGIGKESVDGSQVDGRGTNFAYYQGLKLSLFDVSDVNNPIEVSKFNIGDRGTYSEALYDHKAFLFDKEKGLLVIPVSVYEVKREQYKDGLPPPEAYGSPTFEGAYVFDLNLQKGFVYQGRITHLNVSEQEQMLSQQYYYTYGAQIRRSLYIDNTLYTISERAVKANDLETLDEVNSVELPHPTYNYGPILY